MNSRKPTIAILVMLSASLALAEDFKTINGKEYKNATVSRIEADGIILKTKSGISKVYFNELPEDFSADSIVSRPIKVQPIKRVAARPMRKLPQRF